MGNTFHSLSANARRRLGTAVLLAGASLCATAANAAEATADGSDGIATFNEQIVVSATKRAAPQDAQDVPVAVNAFDAGTLAALKVRDLQSLSHAIPGVSLDPVGTFRGVANWSIRGLGINSSIASIDPAVGTFVDGVYIGINPGAAFDLFDVGSVEVLRGPQGTLFGRNTTGGAVLVETANPTSDWHIRVKGSGEGPVDGGRGAMDMKMQATVSGPLAQGIAFRLGAYHDSDGGYFRNLQNGGNLGKAETTILRAGLSADLGGLRLLAKGEYLDTDGDGAIGQNHGLFARDSFDVSLDNEGYIRAKSWFGTLRADYDFGPGTFTNVFGYRHYRQDTFNDIDSTPSFLFHSATGLRQEQWSNELRYALLFGRVEATVGGYLFHQNIAYEEDRRIPPNPLFYGGGRQKQDVAGLFASADYSLTADLTLNAGLRWSREKKDAEVTFVRIRPACSVIAKTCPIGGTNPSIPGEANGFADDHAWSNFSPRLGLSYRIAPETLVYANWTRGYRSGGYNLRITQPAAFLAIAAAAGSPAFDDERVDSYEMGLKFRTADQRGVLNLAAYRTDVDGMQREINVASATSGLAQSVYNTADARIWGGEAEARFAVTPHLLLAANVGYIHAAYRKVFLDISGDGAIGAADSALALPRVPKWTWGGSLSHELPLGGVSSLVSRVSFQHRSRYAYTDNNFGWVGASDWLDADLTWNLPVKGISLSIYGRNLLDEVQFGGDTQIPFGTGAFSDGNNRPFDPSPAAGTFSPLYKGRVVGVEATFDF